MGGANVCGYTRMQEKLHLTCETYVHTNMQAIAIGSYCVCVCVCVCERERERERVCVSV